MKLHTSSSSPFGRKVKIVALELGLFDRLELVPQQLSPVQPNAVVNDANPLGKIPALIAPSGEAIYDSRVIAEYLDDLAGGHRLFPKETEARYRALTLQAMGDGLMDAAIAVRYELALRPVGLHWSDWTDGLLGKVKRAVARAAELDLAPEPLDIGKITLGCALGYLDFRYPEFSWRKDYPVLDRFMTELEARPSFIKTKPA